MVDMTKDRINRWKCLFCGSKLKKEIKLFDDHHRMVGYSIHCCNCGNINNFALDGAAIDSMIGYKNKIYERKISCGVSGKDIHNCEYEECPFRQKPHHEKENIVKPKTEGEIEPELGDLLVPVKY